MCYFASFILEFGVLHFQPDANVQQSKTVSRFGRDSPLGVGAPYLTHRSHTPFVSAERIRSATPQEKACACKLFIVFFVHFAGLFSTL